VAQAARLPATAVLAGRTDTRRLAALVAGARLVVSADTGVGHLATAYGTPSVVLFGAESPERWGPPVDRARHRALWHGPRAGLASISTAEVLEAVDAAAAQ
jgi:ADP-heptose:LPS heptosyltransferase